MLCNQPFYQTGSPQRGHHAVLLLHGLGGGIYEMKLLANHLHGLGYTVQGINYPGHDRPTRRMPPSNWMQWFGHVEETYLELARNHEHVHVIGFSTGCLLGMHLASQYPIEKLVLLSPFLKVRHEWYYLLPPEAYVHSVGRLVADIPRRRLPIKDQEMLLHAEKAAYFKTFSLSAVRSALELIKIVKSELADVRTPSLIIQSPQDSVVCPSGAQFLDDNLYGGGTRYVHWLRRSDHVVPLDLERHEVLEKVSDFLAD